MKPEQAKKLREPFPPEAVGKLPRVTCGACRQSQSKNCDRHPKKKCNECDNWITTAHLHLDYVGHAETTDRLLQVDPDWSWEPFAIGPDGLPALDANRGLWIRLTVADVSRIGYGHADGKTGPDAVKEAIGDALRNAAMRFGVALDLWGAHGVETDPAEGSQEPEPAVNPTTPDQARVKLRRVCENEAFDLAAVAAAFKQQNGEDLRTATDVDVINAFTFALLADPEGVLAFGRDAA